MKRLIDEGAIGQVKAIWCRHFISYGGEAYFKDWHAERSRATGLLLQKGAHDIDVIHWLAGGYSTQVHAMGGLTVYGDVKDRRHPDEPPRVRSVPDLWPPTAQTGLNPTIDVEDLSMMQMCLDNGVLASYQQCHYTPDAWRNYTVIGTEGRIENFGDFSGDVVVRLWNRPPEYRARGDKEFELSGEARTHGGADPKIVEEFVRFARDGEPASVTPLDARYAVAAGCCATESLRHGSGALAVPQAPEAWRSFFTTQRSWVDPGQARSGCAVCP
jgi:predicted dehydrogenase